MKPEAPPKWYRHWLWASLVPIGFMVVALYWRPVWRDEVWALYYSDPALSFSQTTERLLNNVHPPLYFYILHYWRLLADTVLWAKTLNLLFLLFGLVTVWALGRGQARGHKDVLPFLLLAAGSFWLIYYMAEVRPYALMFVLGAITVFILQRLLDDQPTARRAPLYFLWAIFGALFCLSHYFALLWIGFAGLFTGLVFLQQRRVRDFVFIGLASVVAVVPTIYWISISYSHIGFVNLTPPGSWSNFSAGQTQFWRGIVIKLLFSNPAASLLGLSGMIAVLRARKLQSLDRILMGSVLGTIITLFILHMSWQPLIKERAFMVIIPALLLVLARGIAYKTECQVGNRMGIAVMVFAVLMPFLFISEYFKDREHFDKVRAELASPACKGAPILIYARHFPEGQDFGRYIVHFVAPDIDPVPLETATPARLTAVRASQCPVKALALVLPRGERAEHKKARSRLEAAGLDLQSVQELSIGKGRNLVWTQKP